MDHARGELGVSEYPAEVACITWKNVGAPVWKTSPAQLLNRAAKNLTSDRQIVPTSSWSRPWPSYLDRDIRPGCN